MKNLNFNSVSQLITDVKENIWRFVDSENPEDNDKYTYASILVYADKVDDIVKEAYKHGFHMVDVDFSIEYQHEYVISLSSDYDIYVAPDYIENTNRYLSDDCDYLYYESGISEDAVNAIDCDKCVEFEIK